MTCATLQIELRPAQPRAPIDWHINLRGAGHSSGETMTAGEQMFFLDAPLAHVLAYENQLRLRRMHEARGAARLTRIAIRRG